MSGTESFGQDVGRQLGLDLESSKDGLSSVREAASLGVLLENAVHAVSANLRLDSCVFLPFSSCSSASSIETEPLELSGRSLPEDLDTQLVSFYESIHGFLETYSREQPTLSSSGVWYLSGLFEALSNKEAIADSYSSEAQRDFYSAFEELIESYSAYNWLGSVAIFYAGDLGILAGVRFSDRSYSFSTKDNEFAASFSKSLIKRNRELQGESFASSRRDVFEAMVGGTDALFMALDQDFYLNFISQQSLDFLGLESEQILSAQSTKLVNLVHPDDREKLNELLEEAGEKLEAFEVEFRAVNGLTGDTHWMLAKFKFVDDQWLGFASDNTVRKNALQVVESQSRKIRALYTVSSAIRGYVDPANIASRGLAALCEASRADAGLCFSSRDGEKLSLIAQHGFSHEAATSLVSDKESLGLANYVINNSQPLVVSDLEEDSRAGSMVFESEGFLSAVLVPICVESETIGCLALFSRERSRFQGSDVMLVSAAANQIGLAERQATLFSAFRRQTKILSALYRMSHELRHNEGLDALFNKAFSILQEELGLRRQWVGLLNETSTRIVGHAARGAGWRKRIIEANIELTGEHPFGQVIASKRPLVINDAQQLFSAWGLKRVFAKMGMDSIALIPLLAGGQTLGVLAVQPEAPEHSFGKDELALLSNLANEIASVVLAKRLEERIADQERMRSTGLLAAGVAHNFNNLLQAVLGQASLLSLQTEGLAPDVKDRIHKATGAIQESANRGAQLVRHLSSFTNIETPKREPTDIDTLLKVSRGSFESLLQEEQELVYNLGNLPVRCQVDPTHVLKILRRLVSNAVEASPETGEIELFTNLVLIDESNPHFEVPHGSYVQVSIRDNGPGMDEETKRRCFEPFYSTKEADGGLSLTGAGMGLSASYALARANGGRLTCESRPGHGAVFTLFCPVVESLSDKLIVSDSSSSSSGDKDSGGVSGKSSSQRVPELEKGGVRPKV